MIEIGTLLQERYLIEKQIGAGGMGAVYLAVDQRFDSHVAIKETFYKHDELGEAFEREARLLNSLLHPVLPHVSDYFTENNGHFLVMQYIEGEDLFEILRRDGAFPVTDVLRWLDNLLDALDYLHSHEPPVIHRDIKPQNLKITPRGDIILLDFGLAKLSSADTTGVKSVFGYSRKYSPLEQIQGTGTDARSDIFSLGATMYHLLTGKPPVDVLARAAAIVAGNPDPLRLANELNDEIPPPVAEVLRTSLALNAAGRFVSAKAMRAAVENAVKKDLPETAAESLPEPIIAAPVVGEIISVEEENFPALASFAADINSSAPPDENINETIPESAAEAEIPVFEPAEIPVFEPFIAPQTVVIGNETQIRRSNKSWLMVGVLTAVLFGGCLATWFYISGKNSSEDSLPTPSEQTASVPDAENDEAATNLPAPSAPEISATPVLKSMGKANEAPAKIKAPVENQEAVEDKALAIPETKAIPLPNKTSRNTPQPSTRRPENPNRTAPASDVETVFTGRSREEDEQLRNGGRRRRWQELRRRDDLSEEELEELRRLRRQRRWQRNSRPIPF
jgi:serine/threonine protein kinase